MTGNDTLKKSAWLVSLVGLLLFVAIVGYHGIGFVGAAVTAVGWGLLWITLFHLAPMVIDAYAWQILLDKQHRIGIVKLSGIAWVGEAVNSLLPVALIGGGVVRARLLSLAQVPVAIGGASVVVDLTVAVASLIFFSFAGVAVLVANALPGYFLMQLLPGLLLFSLAVCGFYVAQRRGMFLALARRIERLNGTGVTSELSSNAARLDRHITEIYQRRGDFWYAFAVRLVGWIIGTGEVWLALHYLGHPVTLVDALMLESLVQAIRSAAFLIPGALGIQEGAFMLLGASIGIPPQTGIALSLVKRVRELSLGIPALLIWQEREVRYFRQESVRNPSVAREGK